MSRFIPLTTHIEITAGNDAKAVDGTAPVWASVNWPDLAGATLTLVIGHTSSNVFGNWPMTFTGSVPTLPDSPSSISLDIPGSATTTLPQDEFDYLLTATLTNGDKITVATGKLTVLAEPGNLPLYPPAI